MTQYVQDLQAHYARQWGIEGVRQRWSGGPIAQLPDEFCVLEFPPTAATFTWVYATCGMSPAGALSAIELHLLSPVQHDGHVELLTACAHYHITGAPLGLHHTVNFGRPWLPGSPCDHGFISLPYPFGPRLEHFAGGSAAARCLWLIPVTAAEVEFKKRYGVEMLEKRFEETQFEYIKPERASVC